MSTRTTVYEGFGWHLYRDAEDGGSLWLEVRSRDNAAVEFRLETRVPDAIAEIIGRGLRVPPPWLVEPDDER